MPMRKARPRRARISSGGVVWCLPRLDSSTLPATRPARSAEAPCRALCCDTRHDRAPWPWLPVRLDSASPARRLAATLYRLPHHTSLPTAPMTAHRPALISMNAFLLRVPFKASQANKMLAERRLPLTSLTPWLARRTSEWHVVAVVVQVASTFGCTQATIGRSQSTSRKFCQLPQFARIETRFKVTTNRSAWLIASRLVKCTSDGARR